MFHRTSGVASKPPSRKHIHVLKIITYFNMETVVYRCMHIFSHFGSIIKHKLWVHVRTASPCYINVGLIRVAKTKVLISFAVTAKLICIFGWFRPSKMLVFSCRGSVESFAQVEAMYVAISI